MGGSDKFCFLSGGGLIDDDSLVLELELWEGEEQSVNIEEDSREDDSEDDEDEFNYILMFDEIDVEVTQDLMLLCQCKRNELGEITQVVTDPEAAAPERITKDTVTALFDVKPSHHPELGAYERRREGHEAEDLTVYCEQGSTFLVSYASFVIARAAAPQMELHHWYDLIFHSNGPRHITDRTWAEEGPFSETKSPVLSPDCYYFDGPDCPEMVEPGYGTPRYINYGPIARSVGQFVSLRDVAVEGSRTFRRLRRRTDLSYEEKSREVWLGEGNLWTFAAPNIFPIMETLTKPPFVSFDEETVAERSLTTFSFGKLPLDVLEEMGQYLRPQGLFFLLQVDRLTRAALLPRVHSIAFKSITAQTPHLLPAGPFVGLDAGNPKRGREEVDSWVEEWENWGFDLSQSDDWKESPDVHRIPWLIYAREATKSPNMRNRRRIWGIVLQFVRMYDVLSKARKQKPQDFIPFE